jgi:hypothetical protein
MSLVMMEERAREAQAASRPGGLRASISQAREDPPKASECCAMKSLSVLMAEAPWEAVARLALRWGASVPAEHSRDELQMLERYMRDAVSARFAWESLSEPERRVLFAVVGPSARNWCLREAVPMRAQLGDADGEAAIARLLDVRVIFAETARLQGGELLGQRATFYGYALPRNAQSTIEEKAILYVPTELATNLYTTGREIFLPQADRSELSFDDLLLPYRQGDLDQIGRRFGLTIHSHYSRSEVRAAIAQNLSQAEAVRYALNCLEPPVRAVYEWLRERGGRATFAELRQRTGLQGGALASLVRAFEDYALVFDTFSHGERVLFIPREVLANLRLAEERPPAPTTLSEREACAAVTPEDTPFLWDMAVLVALASHQELDLTRSGLLPKRAALRIVPLLNGARERASEEEALAYVEQLKQEACELGLVVAPRSSAMQRSHLLPGNKIDSWARHDQVMQARRIIRRWPASRWWIDAVGAHYADYLAYYIEHMVAREQVRDALRRCRPGVWYSLATFCATIQGDDPFVFRPGQRSAGDSGFRLANELRAQWDATDGEVVIGMFRSTLCELGIVQLGYDREQVPAPSENVNPDAFCLTPLGAEVLASELSASEQPSPRPLVVQPNFQVLLLEPHMQALYWLVRFAEVEQVGRVSRFTLTREALQQGLAAAGAQMDAVAYLTAHSQRAIPQNVEYTLRDWLRQHDGQTGVIGRKTLLRVGDEALARELVTSPRLQVFRLRRAGPRAVEVPPEASPGELHRALERLGYASRLLGGLDELMASATALPTRRGRKSMRSSAAALKRAT